MRTSTLSALLLAAALLAPACVNDEVTGAGGDDSPSGIDDNNGGSGEGSSETPPPVERILDHDYQVQQTGYWCGPAATRVALSARMPPPSQQTLANELGTTVNGTDWIGQITGVLNDNLGGTFYVTTEMPNDPPTQAQRDQLWVDVVQSIDGNFPIVANIVAPPSNQPPGYPSNQTIYHYFAVVGYNREKREVFIADSANFSGYQHYWLTLDKLATLIPPKGYSSVPAN
jgi:hypothetical protein